MCASQINRPNITQFECRHNKIQEGENRKHVKNENMSQNEHALKE